MLKSFVLKPSRIYARLLTAVHALAIVSVFLTNLPVWACAGLTLAVTANLMFQQRIPQRWRSFTLDKTQLQVSDFSGNTLAGELCSGTLVMPLCVVLCVKLAGQSVCQVIFIDAMAAEDFRDLRVRLRLDR